MRAHPPPRPARSAHISGPTPSRLAHAPTCFAHRAFQGAESAPLASLDTLAAGAAIPGNPGAQNAPDAAGVSGVPAPTGAPGSPSDPVVGAYNELVDHPELMQELQARALVQAAAAAGLSPSAAMAALPLLPNLQEGMGGTICPNAVALVEGEEVPPPHLRFQISEHPQVDQHVLRDKERGGDAAREVGASSWPHGSHLLISAGQRRDGSGRRQQSGRPVIHLLRVPQGQSRCPPPERRLTLPCSGCETPCSPPA